MLEVKELTISFTQYQVGLRQRDLKVITDLSLDVAPGEIVAIVGSSGSGKSLLAHAVLGILPNNARVSGELYFEGEKLEPKRQAALRGRRIALIPQAVTFLDPLMRVGQQARDIGSGEVGAARQREVFARYGLAEHVDEMYPFQLSGGMLRRVLVSTAVLSGASLIIADEPTPGLDPAAVRETLGHMRELANDGRGVMLITHDLMAARSVADRVAVFYAGTTLEVAKSSAFSGDGEALLHPYSRGLWRAMPDCDFTPMPGAQPMPDNMPDGCVFEPRCPRATPECAAAAPDPSAHDSSWVRCFHA
ncbi:MAG: ABC transporter ATP-binding protein [Actinomycetota bacterium]|nr:ABC transporter ATP-binding protein [Actinomycetota bacterium]